MTDKLSVWAKMLIDNDEFIDSMEKQIRNIMKDGRIDSNDIPEFILIITELYNLTELKVKYDELPNVINEVVQYLLNKYNLVPEEETEQFAKMINMAIKLVIMKPKVKKSILKKLLFCK